MLASMSTLPRPVRRAIICTDVEGFGVPSRTGPDQLAVRAGLYRALKTAFAGAGVPWQHCYHEDRGDGVLILVASEVPQSLLAARIPEGLAAALAEHNRTHDPPAWIRMRLAVHAGEVYQDEHGVVGTAVNQAFRLLEADPLRRALAGSRGVLAMICSQGFFEEVIMHAPGCVPDRYRPVRVLVKETDVTGWVYLPDDPDAPGHIAAQATAAMAAVPRQLPAAIAGFTGRQAELRTLDDLVREPAAAGTPVIAAVSGTAGVGKTTLAVHWAHRVAGWFPGGQLYVNLRGFGPSRQVMTAAEAVHGFLHALGAPPDRIPDSLDAQAALYRSLLAGRRMLVVLDNAFSVDQIRPLLPGSPGCTTVVTSRDRLDELIRDEGARPLSVSLPSQDDARALLAGRIGQARVAADPEAVQAIIESCAGLPLALSIVAARAVLHPEFSLEALAGELPRTRHATLGTFHDQNQAQVDAAFSWSYQRLSAGAARLFRLLEVHPGPDIAPAAAASLAALPPGQARNALAELDRAHLVTEHVPGRFAFHDLLRRYARVQARRYDTKTSRQAAMNRVLDHYLHSAHAAAIRLHPRWEPVSLPHLQSGVRPERCAGSATAWSWFEAEHPVLLAVIRQAASTGQAAYTWQLSWTLMDYLDRRGRWHELTAIQRTALHAARSQADQQGQAHAHEALGIGYRLLARYDKAAAHLRKALSLFEELGDQIGQADTQSGFIWLYQYRDNPEKALGPAGKALALYRAVGHRNGEANALSDIAWAHARLNHGDETLEYGVQALTLFRELGDQHGQAHTLDTLGYAYRQRGDHRSAARHYRQSLKLHKKLLDRYHQAVALDHLGDACQAIGDQDAARTAWQQALDHLGHFPGYGRFPDDYPDPGQICAKLGQLSDPDPDPQSSTAPQRYRSAPSSNRLVPSSANQAS